MEQFYPILFICWAAIVGFIIFALAGFPWLMSKRKQAKCQRQTKNLLEQWGIQIYDYDPTWQPTVYFLNSGGKLLSLSILNFSQLNMPQTEMPQWWLLLLWTGKEKSVKQGTYYLIHNGQVDLNHWHFMPYGAIDENSHILKLHLYDRDGKVAIIKEPWDQGYGQLIQKILEQVSTYRDVSDAWLQAIQKEGAPLLLETKDTMGKSPRIEAFRRVLENGPTSFFEIGEPILPSISA